MRTTKRFTPVVLRRFERERRGEGTYADYRGQHQVTRGDPASRGRSHLLCFRGRLRDLLSDGEWHEQLFATMLPDLDDCREQQPLSVEPSPCLLSEYGDANPLTRFPGTQELAAQLGIKHPRASERGETALWRLSTDLVLIRQSRGRRRSVLAIASKPEADLTSPRKRQLLELERAYWRVRGHEWMLLTERCYDRAVALTLRRIAPWALGPASSRAHRAVAIEIARRRPEAPLSRVISEASDALGDQDRAQRALWQAVWTGELPIDLVRGWRPHVPLRHVSSELFRDFNPIAARRSEWS
jgi:hypothetical protein